MEVCVGGLVGGLIGGLNGSLVGACFWRRKGGGFAMGLMPLFLLERGGGGFGKGEGEVVLGLFWGEFRFVRG